MTTADKDISKVAFVSLGCPKNLVDSESMLGTLVDFRDYDEAANRR